MQGKRQIKFWFRNEKELMKSLGLKGTPGSGNKIIKEDGQNDHLIAQLKSTDGSSITIKLADINSLMYNAAVTHKLPLFINQFIDGPVLVSMRLQDIPVIAEYLKTGEVKSRYEDDLILDKKPAAKKPLIRSGNRSKVRSKMIAEREQKYSKGRTKRNE